MLKEHGRLMKLYQHGCIQQLVQGICCEIRSLTWKRVKV